MSVYRNTLNVFAMLFVRASLPRLLKGKGQPIRRDRSAATLQRTQSKVSLGFERSCVSFRLKVRVNFLHHDGLGIKDNLDFLPRRNCYDFLFLIADRRTLNNLAKFDRSRKWIIFLSAGDIHRSRFPLWNIY